MQAQGNTILLTGGTSGIGMELLRQFYTEGNKLIVVSSNPEKLNKLHSEFPNVSTVVCDLANPKSLRKLLEHCLNTYPEINILINNAGIQYNYQWLEEDDGFHRISREIRVNLTSPMHLIYGFLPQLAGKDQAAIINVTSALAFHPKKSAPVYCATKAGLHNLSKSLRYQLAGTSVKVFEIIPPLVDTPMTRGRGKNKMTPEAVADEFMSGFKKNRFQIFIGKAKWLRLIGRIIPILADRILKNA
jgi:short-subunit dehydrogenase involved in D-alanine esterification of teichoic acids